MPRLAACLDTGHARSPASRRTVSRQPRSEAAARHLKDARSATLVERRSAGGRDGGCSTRPEPTFPGGGALDVAGLIAALERMSFTGTISLEHEGDDPEAALAELLDRLRAAGLRVRRGRHSGEEHRLAGPRRDGG